MEHQHWEETRISKSSKKTPAHTQKDQNVQKDKKSALIVPQESLDINDKKIEWFTPEMGKRIAALRLEKKVTQEELAKRMGMTKKTISDIEYGNKEKYQGAIVAKLKQVLGNFSW
jgi:DNA-binding XRE family transcriptional regulator